MGAGARLSAKLRRLSPRLRGGGGRPRPRRPLLAPGPQGEAQEGPAAQGRLLRPPEEEPGEELPEEEVHQQA